jgi:hypothetical protein
VRAPGRWRWNSLTLELWRDGKHIATILRHGSRYHYQIALPGRHMIAGWSDSRYAAQREVRRIIREEEALNGH